METVFNFINFGLPLEARVRGRFEARTDTNDPQLAATKGRIFFSVGA